MANVLNRSTKQYLQSVHTPDYPVADWIINPELAAVVGFASKYWTITGDVVSLMSQAQRDSVDASEAAARVASIQAAAKAGYLAAQSDIYKAIKGLGLATQKELNLHALRLNAICAAINNPGVTSFATLKTSIAGITDYPPRTPTQLRAAVDSEIEGL